MGAIIWDGISSRRFGIQVERYPNQSMPVRAIESIAISGRNGALTIDSGRFENYQQPYEIYFNANRIKTPAAAREIKRWLQLPTGYRRLEDTYSPGLYRMARFTGGADIENVMNLFGRMTLYFDCQPQSWLKSGEFPIAFAQAGALINSWFPALPLIRVNGTGAGTLYIGQYAVQINALDGYVMLDSETQNAYKGTENKNSTVFVQEFPVLQPGENPVSWQGQINSVEITPRWWTL